MLSQEDIENIISRSILNLDLKGEPESLYQPLEYMISVGGKRVRPRLCLTVFNLFSDNVGNDIIYPAIALEMFHEFSLLHDDIMDNSDTRRNQPTVFKKWGTNKAILSGDVMLLLAYKYMSFCNAEVMPEALRLFTDTAIKVCEGQQFDMDFEEKPFITMSDYISMIGLKTGVLLACSAKMGALIAGASREIRDALYQFGYRLGLAFQIADDYLDTFGDQQIFGKKIGDDIVNDKKTWLQVECIRRAEGADKERLASILEMGEEMREEKVAAMQQLYIDLGIKDDARDAILEYHNKAFEAISGIGLNEVQTRQLHQFAEQLIHREK